MLYTKTLVVSLTLLGTHSAAAAAKPPECFVRMSYMNIGPGGDLKQNVGPLYQDKRQSLPKDGAWAIFRKTNTKIKRRSCFGGKCPGITAQIFDRKGSVLSEFSSPLDFVNGDFVETTVRTSGDYKGQVFNAVSTSIRCDFGSQ